MSEGKRKLLFGDCLELMKLIPTGSVDLIVTDPPYEIEDMKPYFAEMLRCLSKDGSIYVFGNKNMIAEHWFSQMKIDKKELLIWHYKNSPKPKDTKSFITFTRDSKKKNL